MLNHSHQESVQLIKWQVANVRLLLINNLRKWILYRFFSFCFFFSKTFETASIERKKKHKINFLKLGFFSFDWHRLTFLNRCEWFSLYFHTFESIQTFRFFYNILFWKRFRPARLHGYRVRSSKAPDFGICLISQTTAMLITHQETSSVADIVITFVILSM